MMKNKLKYLQSNIHNNEINRLYVKYKNDANEKSKFFHSVIFSVYGLLYYFWFIADRYKKDTAPMDKVALFIY